MALIPNPSTEPAIRGREEILDQLRAVRRQYRKGYGPLQRALQAHNNALCWVLGATQAELQTGTFLGGILNVDF